MRYDDPARHGQCHKPMAKKQARFFAILHQKLRGLDHCLKLLYHLESGQTHTWSEVNPRVKAALGLSKATVIEKIRSSTGMLLDSPTSSGGNTNNGPLASRFFSPENREAICAVINNSADRENFRVLLSKFNVLLSITQHVDSTKLVDPEKVKDLGYGLMIHHKQSFPFAMISPSVHQMCAHSHELFRLTNGEPIAQYSEESGESWNKFIRAYKSGTSCKARQMSIKVNTRDIFCRLMIRTHPLIASKKRMLLCTTCGLFGHTCRSCKEGVEKVQSEEEFMKNNCFL